MLSEKPEDRTLVALASEQIIEYIVSKDLKPKEKLPTEGAFARLLGVGRSTVREAVKLLVSRNILEVRQGAGTFLVDGAPGIANDPLGFTFIRDKRKLIEDLMEVRMMIEPQTAALAARHASGEQLDTLRRCCLDVETCIHAGENYTQKDAGLHAQIAACAGNIVLPTLLPVIHQAIFMFVNVAHRQLKTETIETHRALVDAIALRDSAAAREAMVRHLAINRSNIETLFTL